MADAQDLGDDAADFRRGVELALAFATLGGEVPHEVFVGIAQKVVAIGAVLGEIEGGVFENGDEVGEALHHFLAAAELVRVVEVRHVGQLVGLCERAKDAFIDLVADVRFALEGDHVGEGGPRRDGDRRVGLARVFVADVFDEQEDEDVILVLAGIRAAA